MGIVFFGRFIKLILNKQQVGGLLYVKSSIYLCWMCAPVEGFSQMFGPYNWKGSAASSALTMAEIWAKLESMRRVGAGLAPATLAKLDHCRRAALGPSPKRGETTRCAAAKEKGLGP
jgi:hypothetical protein